jgi:hypothetical protein
MVLYGLPCPPCSHETPPSLSYPTLSPKSTLPHLTAPAPVNLGPNNNENPLLMPPRSCACILSAVSHVAYAHAQCRTSAAYPTHSLQSRSLRLLVGSRIPLPVTGSARLERKALPLTTAQPVPHAAPHAGRSSCTRHSAAPLIRPSTPAAPEKAFSCRRLFPSDCIWAAPSASEPRAELGTIRSPGAKSSRSAR